MPPRKLKVNHPGVPSGGIRGSSKSSVESLSCLAANRLYPSRKKRPRLHLTPASPNSGGIPPDDYIITEDDSNYPYGCSSGIQKIPSKEDKEKYGDHIKNLPKRLCVYNRNKLNFLYIVLLKSLISLKRLLNHLITLE